jgi:hypothetical protein
MRAMRATRRRVTRKVENTENTSLIMHRPAQAHRNFCIAGVFLHLRFFCFVRVRYCWHMEATPTSASGLGRSEGYRECD